VQRIRDDLRQRVAEVVTTYSFTPDEEAEAEKAGLRGDDAIFDEAIAEIYHRQSQLVLDDEAGFTDSSY